MGGLVDDLLFAPCFFWAHCYLFEVGLEPLLSVFPPPHFLPKPQHRTVCLEASNAYRLWASSFVMTLLLRYSE